jgi:hypothetical protein
VATRNEVSIALFELLKTAEDFKTFSRRMKTFDTISQADKPALFLIDTTENHQKQQQVTPAIRILNFDAYVFIFTGSSKAIPADALNDLIDKIDPNSGGVLKPNDVIANRQTLGGLVYNVFIDGEMIKVPGDLDGQGVAIIPIKVVLP